MSLRIVKQDITKVKADAIVNSTNIYMIGFSGVDALLHKIGGEAFEEECHSQRGKCALGEAIYTKAYNIPYKYVIHTAAPEWEGGMVGEAAILSSCYRKSLELAEELGCKSIAFPLIAAGSMGYPIHKAFEIAITTIKEHLSFYEDLDVSLVLFGSAAKAIEETTFDGLDDYILNAKEPMICMDTFACFTTEPVTKDLSISLPDLLDSPGEDFVTKLYRFMDEKGINKASTIYKKAGISKSAYSKLISGGSKKPSRETAIGLAMALKLSYEETTEFLASAGIALSESDTFDIIVSFFIKSGNYDIWQLEVQLEKYGCKSLLGC